MKKNMMMRIASVLLVAVLLSTCAISGTFAKYVSESTGSSSARVAKWDIQFEGAAIANTFNFDLFETVNDANVKDGVTENIIAPGTEGEFVLNLANQSEVNAKYSIDYTVTNTANIPVEFSVNGGTWKSSLDDVVDAAMNMGDAPTYTIQWRWAYEVGTGDDLVTNDAKDTDLGLAGTATIVVKAVVTVTQVD